MALDYAVLGSIDFSASAELDAETAGPGVTAAYAGAGIDLPSAAHITMLASQCVWRITGTDVKHLLRAERGSITVIEEAYGHRTVSAASLDRIGMTRRWSQPTFLLEADGITYGIPMHQASRFDETLVDLARFAYADRTPVELEIRRSAFWRMDGSLDEIAAAVTGIRLG